MLREGEKGGKGEERKRGEQKEEEKRKGGRRREKERGEKINTKTGKEERKMEREKKEERKKNRKRERKRKNEEGRRTELKRRAITMQHFGVDTTRINKLLKAPTNKSNIAEQKTAWFSVRECLCLTEKFEVTKYNFRRTENKGI